MTSARNEHGISFVPAVQRTRRSRARRLIAVTAVVAVIGVACGRSDDTTANGDDSTSGAPGTTSATTAPSGPAPGEFGDIGAVCGPAPEGASLGATDVGVTADSVQIGAIADPGFSGRPGLNQEFFDTAEAFTKWCNEAGGIYGRKIELKERDAKLTEFQPRMIEACDEGDFMLVGGGGVFDDQGQKERLACGLPTIAGMLVNPPAAEGDLAMVPLANPADTMLVGDLPWLEEKFPEAVKKVGILTGGVAVTITASERAKEAMKAHGWEFVYDEQFNPAGESSWRGFVEGMKSAGVRAVVWTADPSALVSLLKEMDELEFHPDFVRGASNLYDALLLGEAGAAADNLYLAGTQYPFLDPELAAENPATQQYLDIIDSYDPGGKVASLGVTGFSAWLLWARSAQACGADLTRDCVWEHAKSESEWTGGGLHARQNLAEKIATECFYEIAAIDGEWTYPDVGANEGIFNCGPDNVMEMQGDYGEGAKCENPAFADDPKPSRCAS